MYVQSVWFEYARYLHLHSPIIPFSWNSCVPKSAYKAPTLSACGGPKLGNNWSAYCVALAVAAVVWSTNLTPSKVFVMERSAS
jgi:hypothetical protein